MVLRFVCLSPLGDFIYTIRKKNDDEKRGGSEKYSLCCHLFVAQQTHFFLFKGVII